MNFLITCGGTREFIDPVRYLGNASSGKMGFSIAKQASKRGHSVFVVGANIDPSYLAAMKKECANISVEYLDNFIGIVSTDQLIKQISHVMDNESIDVIVMAAAISDYKPERYDLAKIKRGEDDLFLKLVPNPDVTKYIRDDLNFTGTLVNFALETEDLVKNAEKKLRQKKCDLLVANQITEEFNPIGNAKNQVCLFQADGQHEELPFMAKGILASVIVEKIEVICSKKMLVT